MQGEIEAALAAVIGEPVETTGAGRTDAGVHARRQVLSFRTGASFDLDAVTRAVTGMSGGEIVGVACVVADREFDARFSARSRTYRYHVDDGPHPDPLRRHTTWHVGRPLDIDRMNVAMSHVVGEHDFASFCRRREGATTTRTVTSAAWKRRDDVILSISAKAFCHQMVRSLVGLSVSAGAGRTDPGTVPDIIAALDRSAAPQIAPPHGLVLWDVEYGTSPGISS